MRHFVYIVGGCTALTMYRREDYRGVDPETFMDFCTRESFIIKCIRITCGDSETDPRELIRSLARMDTRRAGPDCGGRRQKHADASNLAGKKLESRRNSVRVQERHVPGHSRDDGYNERSGCEHPSA